MKMEKKLDRRSKMWFAGGTKRGGRTSYGAICLSAGASGYQDLVTRWDKETEQFLRRGISEAFPQDIIVGEEYPAANEGAEGCTWYLDPIDGTTNFVSQHRNYAVSVGCWRGEEPLFGLVLDVERPALYWAQAGSGAFRDGTPLHTSRRREVQELLLTVPGVPRTLLNPHPRQEGLLRLAREVRGVRSLGSVALELCALAAGEADLFVTLRSCPWDHNAGRIILAEAGGSLCDLEGEFLPLDRRTPVLAANAPETLRLVRERYLGAAE